MGTRQLALVLASAVLCVSLIIPSNGQMVDDLPSGDVEVLFGSDVMCEFHTTHDRC